MAQAQQPTSMQQSSQGGQAGQSRNAGGGGLSRRSSFPLTAQDMFTMHPFTLMRRMSEEMDRIFSEAFTGASGQDSGRTAGNWAPAIEVKQQGNQYVVCAELPGLKKEDVKVELQEDSLVIQGERKFEHDESTGGVHRTERRYGQFYRAIPLPEGANAEQAKARFENGMLEISVPVTQPQSQRREIPIETGASGGTSQGTPAASAASAGASAGSSTKA